MNPANGSWRGSRRIIRAAGGRSAPRAWVAGNSYLADCLPMARPTLITLSAITPRPTQRCIPSSPR